MSRRLVVVCGGRCLRWGNHLGVKKHFAPMDGVPILHRTLAQLRDEPDVFVVARSLPAPEYELGRPVVAAGGCSPSAYGDLRKIVSSRRVWNPDGQTVILFGDVWFSDAAIDKIMSCTEPWAMFGRPGPSVHTGKSWNENFALLFDSELHGWVDQVAARTVISHRAGKVPGVSLTQWYQHAVDRVEREWQVPPDDESSFVVVDDRTEDIDYPVDWLRWHGLDG